jgi:hypothetical protein
MVVIPGGTTKLNVPGVVNSCSPTAGGGAGILIPLGFDIPLILNDI